MKVLLDISQVAYEHTGVARIVEGIIGASTRYSTHEWGFLYYGNKKQLPAELLHMIQRRGWKLHILPIPKRVASWLWNDVHKCNVDSIVRGYDIFISSDWIEPPAKHLKKVTIVYDLIHMLYPEHVHARIIKQHTTRLEHVMKESSCIITDSKSARDDVVRLFPNWQGKTIAWYPGVEFWMHAKPHQSLLAKILEPDTRPIILTVGTRSPRKNITRLIEAFSQSAYLNKNYQLLIVGGYGWGLEEAPAQSVRLLGNVSDDILATLYTSCALFVFPSLYEGFGIPLIEALSMGAPAIAADVASLRELGQDIIPLFNPTQVKSLQDCMEKTLADTHLRASIQAKGQPFARNFTWQSSIQHLDTILSHV